MKIYNINTIDVCNEYKLTQLWGIEDNLYVGVKLSHDNKNLIVEFDVFENEIRRESKFNNDEVYKDSCVECFLKNINSDEYINFELSVSSFMLVAKGKEKERRVFFDEEKIDTIKRELEIISDKKDKCHWRAKIFFDLYYWNLVDVDGLENQSISANFYKCGDNLKHPHYLSLFEIKSQKPNFHKPEFFKELFFL